MLIVLMIVFILAIIISIRADSPEFAAIFVLCFIVSAIVFSHDLALINNVDVIKQELELYETENAKIEEKIENVVSSYMEYESEIITDANKYEGVDSLTIATLGDIYPELAANEMVQHQIELYETNNSSILCLKKKLLRIESKKWWVYFG